MQTTWLCQSFSFWYLYRVYKLFDLIMANIQPGTTRYVSFILFLRSVVGFWGVGFSFLAEKLPLGDAIALAMLGN
jgi:hypothetical protein